MNKILIISPHYPPSNLAGVHRSRLFAQHLPAFGWHPVILTVDEKYYEETLDWNLHKLIPAGQQIEKVSAYKVTKPRLVGDIGLRAFFQLRKRALEIVKAEKIDFVYIPIPSFYLSLIGPWLQRKTVVKFGIDYIDPWVHKFPGSNKMFSRHWFSTRLAAWLEPKALKNVSLITGVAEGYYKAVIERNPQLKSGCVFGAMPYGGEQQDHELLAQLDLKPFLFEKKIGKIQLVYAGAMLPKAYGPLEAIFKAIKNNLPIFKDCEFHFIGTGKLANDANSYNIKPLAEKYGLWQTTVFEYPKRIAYLDVLIHLQHADGIFILGSTEPHYTPSKSYQGVLSGKPILAVLHEASTAVDVINKSGAGKVLHFAGEQDLQKIENEFIDIWNSYNGFLKDFDPGQINKAMFETYSAKSVTAELVKLLNRVVVEHNDKKNSE